MAKKKISEIITEENLKKAALKGFAYERALNSAMNAGAPTYRFAVGDKVQVGHLQNCVVDEVLNDGALYLIRSGPNSDNFACWACSWRIWLIWQTVTGSRICSLTDSSTGKSSGCLALL